MTQSKLIVSIQLRIVLKFVLICFLFFFTKLAVADGNKPTSLQNINAIDDHLDAQLMKKEWMSPWTTQARSWLLTGMGTTSVLILFKKDLVDPIQKDLSTNRPLGNWSQLGDYGGRFIPNALYILGTSSAFIWTQERQYADLSWIMTKASLYAVITSTALKVIVREPRPNDKNDHKSFPSGHTTSAFAFSSVIIGQHGFWPYGFLATGLATLTGFSRINDNKHYLHDVIAGATIGTVFGIGVSEVNKKIIESPSMNSQKVSLSPQWQFIPSFSQDFIGIVGVYH